MAADDKGIGGASAGGSKPGALWAMLHLRCPRCRRGRVFQGMLRMLETCPVCGHRFDRAPGYFVGAMYVSYAMAVPVYLLPALAIYALRPAWPVEWVLAAAAPAPVLLAPVLFRYSRVVWMHIGWAMDPGE